MTLYLASELYDPKHALPMIRSWVGLLPSLLFWAWKERPWEWVISWMRLFPSDWNRLFSGKETKQTTDTPYWQMVYYCRRRLLHAGSFPSQIIPKILGTPHFPVQKIAPKVQSLFPNTGQHIEGRINRVWRGLQCTRSVFRTATLTGKVQLVGWGPWKESTWSLRGSWWIFRGLRGRREFLFWCRKACAARVRVWSRRGSEQSCRWEMAASWAFWDGGLKAIHRKLRPRWAVWWQAWAQGTQFQMIVASTALPCHKSLQCTCSTRIASCW